MHRIMDAERDATIAYLDALTREVGGRRGRAGVLTPTSGLVYAHTRHATSRAGDPNPHDHVLVANVLRMGDDAGGWKAATTALWRQHLHAATMIGRRAAAREAVALGYGIVADDGPTGRLRHWGIAGVPAEVMAVHSKRAAEITSGWTAWATPPTGPRGSSPATTGPVSATSRSASWCRDGTPSWPRWAGRWLSWPGRWRRPGPGAARPRPCVSTNASAWSPMCSPPTGPWPSARCSPAATS